MRTIDPNALSQRILKSKEQTADRMIPVGAVLEMIRTEKDETRHGHWIIGDWHKSDGVYPDQAKKCSCCFRTCHITQIPSDTVYCPWCGAAMDLEGEYSEND